MKSNRTMVTVALVCLTAVLGGGLLQALSSIQSYVPGIQPAAATVSTEQQSRIQDCKALQPKFDQRLLVVGGFYAGQQLRVNQLSYDEYVSGDIMVGNNVRLANVVLECGLLRPANAK
jgi:hypothetical protein